MKAVLILKNLNCAHCAAKIEKKVGELKEVDNAALDFMSQKLTIESNKIDEAIKKAVQIINKTEPEVEVIRESNRVHDHSHNKNKIITVALGAVLFVAGILTGHEQIKFWILFASYVISGGDVLLKAVKNLFRASVLDENFLMGIATVGAFLTRNYTEGVAVMLFYQVGELFQDHAVEKSRRSIKDLMNIRPDSANLLVDGEIHTVDPKAVNVGDKIVVKPGERIALDGVILQGSTCLDTSALTGESVPQDVEVGGEVLSGSVNLTGAITVQVTKPFGESTVSKILDLVENAGSKKAESERFISVFAKYYTPIVVALAVVLAVVPPLVLADASFGDWVYRALTFLVISCPCALVISIPLSFFCGIGAASKNGVLIKGGNYLEALSKAETVVFDKTGTLTKGQFRVCEINTAGMDKQKLLELAAYAEYYSNHPIAAAIKQEYGRAINAELIKDYNEISGFGVQMTMENHIVSLGNHKLMEKMGVAYSKKIPGATVAYIALDGEYAGQIIVSDVIKEDSAYAVAQLKKQGVKNVVMLTGDSADAADKVAKDLGIEKVYANLLPIDKVDKTEQLLLEKSSKGKLIFAGDGINDAPVLARADIGVAMGGIGSDAAIEAADVVVMTDQPSKIPQAVALSKKTMAVVKQNIILSLGVKGAVLVLGAFGVATMWSAVFADVGVAALAILNAIRILAKKS